MIDNHKSADGSFLYLESWKLEKKACIDPSINPSLSISCVFLCVFVRVFRKKERSFACESKWAKKGIVSKCEVCEVA